MVLKPAFNSAGNEEAIKAALELLNFLEQKGLDINKPDSAGCSSIHMAYYFKEKEILEILTSRYSNSVFKGNPNATVPLCRKDANELLN